LEALFSVDVMAMVSSQKLKVLTAGGILSSALLATALLPQSAQAVIVFNVFQSGSDVVVSTAGGTLDLALLTGGSTSTWNSATYFGGDGDLLGAGITSNISGSRTIYFGSFSTVRSGGWTNGPSLEEFSPSEIFTSATGSGIVASFGSGPVSLLNLDTSGISGTTYINSGFSLTIGNQTIGSGGLNLTPNSSITTSWGGGGAGREITMLVAPATPVPFESNAVPVVGTVLFMAGGLWWKRQRQGKTLQIENN
jgi:hypothetical protein